MKRETTIPHRLLSLTGWLYALAGRERCEICGGPLPAGETRAVALNLSTDHGEVDLALCRSCDAAWIAGDGNLEVTYSTDGEIALSPVYPEN
jgi:hypothetical protein